ncbi:MAG TPA: hypothetical protein VHE99_10335 [Gammaproteobacteria bacterium]|nr:hypothetical protein [Gammaproteobacteria bacterium]
MHPYPFSMDDPLGSPVYYSYQVNNLLTSLPASRGPASTINELLNLHELLAHLLEEANSDSKKIENTYIADMVKKVSFDFFHSDITEQYSEIQHTSQMSENDPALIQLDSKYGQRKFAESAHFIRGCVRISVGNNTLINRKV